ncbi:MAG: hypothetical protein K9K66_13670 [Desulfarculaceae bacterium]|nr:hypothetical protein [Desulfarculaceae bacterium]MCF8074013.1 hypothetical protein [Desulfarculaceae bacterium]MCF8102699.1 hypothetical protein [Desulfarculaceae bacterium]MCF8116060.1 hypothetical protein [Desulfarculaceae bacterium]
MEIWLPAYLKQRRNPRPDDREPVQVCLAITDHWEPYWAKADDALAMARLEAWEQGWPRVTEGLADCRGRSPQHDFYYPLEDYRPEMLDRLAALCARGLGSVEVHLHHHGESSRELEDLLAGYARKLHHEHGLLERDPETGQVTYGFIHGNWALDNSLPDGSWCGRDDEISILARTGCYADFTLPSAPSPAQTRIINSIYYATDDPHRPKSHDSGDPAAVGRPPRGDLLMVQGVLALDWGRRKYGLLPHLEVSDLSWHNPPSLRRMPLWLDYAPVVRGAEKVRFIKLTCHGAPEKNQAVLLGAPMRAFLQGLVSRYNDGQRYCLKFMTSREMAQAIHRLERGEFPAC